MHMICIIFANANEISIRNTSESESTTSRKFK